MLIISSPPSRRSSPPAGGGGGGFTPPYSLPGVGETLEIGTNSAEDVKPASHSDSQWQYACFDSYSGGAFVEDYSEGGAFVIAGSGGHQVPVNLGAIAFDFEDQLFKRHDPSNSPGDPGRVNDYNVDTETTGAPNYEVTGSGGLIAPAHACNTLVPVPISEGGGTKGSVAYITRVAIGTTGNAGSPSGHRFELAATTGAWSQLGSNDAPRFSTYGSAVYDTARRRYWLQCSVENLFNTMLYYDLTDGSFKVTAAASHYIPDGAARGMNFMYDGLLIRHGSLGTQYLYCYDPDDNNAGMNLLTWSGDAVLQDTIDINCPWTYYPATGKFYKTLYPNGTTLYRLTPPTSSPKTNTWVVDTVTVSPGLIEEYKTGASPAGVHNRLFYVPSIQRLAWMPGGNTNGVQLINPG